MDAVLCAHNTQECTASVATNRCDCVKANIFREGKESDMKADCALEQREDPFFLSPARPPRQNREQDRKKSFRVKHRHAFYAHNPYSGTFPGVLAPNILRSLHLDQEKQLLQANRKTFQIEPIFCGFQLVGDSLLLRFAEQVLQQECKYERRGRRLGLCVSGQTIGQLKRRAAARAAALADKVILLIGTNDLLQGRDIETMKLGFDELVDILEESVKWLIILTLPPIPKLEDNEGFRMKFKEFNDFLKLFPRKYANIIYINMTSLFQTEDNNSNIDYFERWYDTLQSRPDLVHLNHTGLVLLGQRILSRCFRDKN